MAFSADKENQQHSASWFRSKKKAFNNLLFNSKPLTPNNQIHTDKTHHFTPKEHLPPDKTSILSDEILLKILSKLPKSQRNSNSLVSKRWLNLQGRLVRSIKILDWHFLVSGRLLLRFPNLIRVDLVNGCLITPEKNSSGVGVSVTNGKDWFFPEENRVLSCNEVDGGLRVLAGGFPNLKKIAVTNATEMGLLSVAEGCPVLQELELRMCSDRVLRGIAACRNLQILRLIGVQEDGGSFDGSCVSDVGLTILGQGCKGLMKLELSGCRGSFEGIRAIGQCCLMLEELTISNHDMEDGWMSALPSFENLKSLRLVSCKRIDGGCSLDEDSECCPALESLHLDKCQMRDVKSSTELFRICRNARRLVLHNCWGLGEAIFATATALRYTNTSLSTLQILLASIIVIIQSLALFRDIIKWQTY